MRRLLCCHFTASSRFGDHLKVVAHTPAPVAQPIPSQELKEQPRWALLHVSDARLPERLLSGFQRSAFKGLEKVAVVVDEH